MISRAWLWTGIVIAFFLGVLVAKAPFFDIDRRLTSGDIFGALVTIFIALSLGVVFHRNFSETRGEKDLLMGQIREVTSSAKTARELFLEAYTGTASKATFPELLAAIRNLSSHLTALERAAAGCETDYRSPSLAKARDDVRTLRKVLTDEALVEGSSYSAATYGRAEAAFASFAQQMLMCSIHVNKR